MRLEIMGPPGAGKGTQAGRLSRLADVPHISTGDMFRASIKADSALGRTVRDLLARGELVPDGTVAQMVRQRLEQGDCAGGYLLDGFPRTVEQVLALDGILEDNSWRRTAVLSLTVPDAEVVRRLSSRRTCGDCGAITGGEATACSACGGRNLAQRDDDREDVVRERLQVYADSTAPVLAVYRERGLLSEVDGTGSPEAVFDRLRHALEAAV